MRNWLNLIIILIIMALFGCRTMDGQGSAAGAGTYPLKSTPAAEDTVLLTVIDATKAGGFDIRRTPVANMPVSTPVSTALGLKQDAATAITESDVQDIVDDAVADIPSSTVVADETDPTKAAAAVVADSATTATTADSATTASHATTADSATTAGSATTADSATYATTAGTAGTVTAVSGTAITSGTVDEARIDSNIARDSEVADAINGIVIPPPSTILPDGTDPTKAAAAVTADSATTATTATTATSATSAGTADHATTADSATTAGSATVADSATTADHATTADSATTATSADTATTATTATTAGSADYATSAGSAAAVEPVKTSGVPGMMAVHEAEGTSTLKTGFIGPANSTVNFVYQYPDSVPSSGDTFVMGTPATGQTLPDGSTGTIIPLTHAAGGGSGVPGGTSTNDILSWDGDSWEPIALTDHPAFSSLLTAFNNAGLNSFTFPSSSIFPIYTNDATYTLSVDITDTSTTYAVNAVNYKLDSGEYAAMTNTTGDTWSVTLPTQTDGTYDLRFNAADDKSTPNTGESDVYTGALIVDLTNPSIGTTTPSALTHNGTGETFTADITGVTETNEDNREWSLYDVTDAAIQVAWTTFTGLSITGISIPADQHTYRLDVRCTDLAGNVGTASSSNIVYSAGASVPDFQWNLDDNAASTTVLATYGGINGTLAGSGNTSDAQTGGGLLLGTSGYVGMALPTATFTAGSWTIQAAYDYVAVPSSQWPRLITESSGGNEAVVWWDTVTQRFRVYINGVATDPTQTVDFTDGVKRYIRLVWNASNTTAYLYMGTSELNLSLVHSWAGTQPNAWGGTTYIGSGGGSGFWRGVVDDVKMWDEAVIP